MMTIKHQNYYCTLCNLGQQDPEEIMKLILSNQRDSQTANILPSFFRKLFKYKVIYTGAGRFYLLAPM